MKRILVLVFAIVLCIMPCAESAYAAFPAAAPAAPVESVAGAKVAGSTAVVSTARSKTRATRVKSKGARVHKKGKSQVVALLLNIFVGLFGIHRFYLGYIWQGVVQLLTLGGFGIWALIDLVRVIIGDLQPKNGQYTDTL